jgi:Ca2+-binding RTX toxin-like protein
VSGTVQNDDIFGHIGSEGIYGSAGDDILHYSNDEFITATNGFARNVGSPDHILLNEAKITVAPRYMSHDGFDGGNGYDILEMGSNSEALFLDNSHRANPFGNNGAVVNGAARLVSVEEIRAGAGDDIIDLTSKTLSYGDVTLKGGDGNDVLWASSGNDHLQGDSGNDNLFGGTGNDQLNGGTGADTLAGGWGADSFDFSNLSDSTAASHDIIMDFEDGIDHIDFSGLVDEGIDGFSDLTITNDGTNTHITANSHDFQVDLVGVFALDDSDFVW